MKGYGKIIAVSAATTIVILLILALIGYASSGDARFVERGIEKGIPTWQIEDCLKPEHHRQRNLYCDW